MRYALPAVPDIAVMSPGYQGIKLGLVPQELDLNAGRPGKKFLPVVGVLDRSWHISCPFLFGKTSAKHTAEPRDCLCRPRARRSVGVMG